MEENLFSKTFHTSIVEAQSTVSAKMEGDKVELMNVSKAFSFDLRSNQFGFKIKVYSPERSLRNLSRINCGSSSSSNILKPLKFDASTQYNLCCLV